MASSKEIAVDFNNNQFWKNLLIKFYQEYQKYFSLGFNTYFGNSLNYKLSIMNFQN